jgi:hypothetical protein
MALVGGVGGSTGSCGAAGPGQVPESDFEAPPAEHVSTRSVLRAAAEYRSWPRFPEHRSGPIKSWSHDALWFVAHYNDAAADTMAGRSAQFAEWSIIVGENRATPDGPPVALTTMAKHPDGWRFIGHEPGGRVFVTGHVDTCRGCHERAVRDMVFGGPGEEL